MEWRDVEDDAIPDEEGPIEEPDEPPVTIPEDEPKTDTVEGDA